MASDWRMITLRDLGNIITGKTPPSSISGCFGGNTPFVTPSDFNGRRIIDSTERYLTEKGLQSVAASRIPPRAIMVTCIGSDMGKAAMAASECITNQQINSIVVEPVNYPEFVYYNLSARKAEIRATAGGSAQPILNKSTFGQFKIFLPPLLEQKAIACILGVLDDRIELNRGTNKNLHEIACSLFESWFIKFDPVVAKAQWRATQVDKRVVDLFPDEFNDSQLGQIPQGWKIGSFGDFISKRNERVNTRDIVVLSAVASGKLVMSDDHFTKRVYSKETTKYLIVEQWDFAYNPSRINIGSIGMLEEQIIGGVSPVYVVFRPKPAYRWFLEFTLRRASTKAWINTLASGSVRQSLSFSDFASIPCIVPPEGVVQEFNRVWGSLRESIISRDKISKTLSALRDTLLPRLLSGELKILDAERIVGRCA